MPPFQFYAQQDQQPYAESEVKPPQSVSNIWYAVTAVIGFFVPLFGMIAGVALYFAFKNKNPRKAKNILIFSFVWAIAIYIVNIALSYYFPI